MKQSINIGNVVDDGQGDYLRVGGQKINANFSEIYDELGDGSRPYAAGAWKTHTFLQGALDPDFGDSFAVNTSAGALTVNLPKGSQQDYNKVIKLRDVWGTWLERPVTIRPATGDTIKGDPNPTLLQKDLMDVELVYCSPGRWEYVENKLLNRITSSDLSTVAKKEFLITQEGQTDFPDVFGADSYNVNSIEVYLRGNLLYYGNELTDNSNYGSIDPANPDTVLPLDGRSIRLKIPCNVGDTVTVVTYLDGIASYRSSYNRHTVQVFQTGDINKESVSGDIFVGDLSTKTEFSFKDDFGISPRSVVNPNSLEVFLNGRELTMAGEGAFPFFICEDTQGGIYPDIPESTCVGLGYQWKESGQDFSVSYSVDDLPTGIYIREPLESGDILVVKWFNNDIGSIMEWDGDNGIKAHTDKIYLNNEGTVRITDTIRYNDFDNPSQSTMEPVPGEQIGRIPDVQGFFDSIYPIGTIYKNATNPANPAKYMGFGVWKRYAEGRFIAGWSSDATDLEFSLNNNHNDNQGNPSKTAGGTYGSKSTKLEKINIPELISKEKVLVTNENGNIIIGGCQLDPDAQGPGYTKYIEAPLKVNDGVTPSDISILPPLITAYVWVRVA